MTPAPVPARAFVTVDDARWAQAHGSTVLALPDGTLVAAWFAGLREGADDTAIWLARRSPGATTWSEPVRVLDAPEPHWNPVLAAGPDGATWLFAKRGALISGWSTVVRTSTDGGLSWDDERELVPGDAGGRGPVRNPPVVAPDGTWLAPSSLETWGERPRWEAFVDRSTDGGRTWAAAPIPLQRAGLRGAGVIQPTLWLDGVRVRALLRSSEGVAFASTSEDAGRTWSPARPTTLPNNNSGLAAVGLPDGGVLVAHNPTTGDWAARCPLVLSVAAGDGAPESAAWRQVAVLDDGVTPVDDDPAHRPALPGGPGFAPADGGVTTDGVGEYSYPALALADGVVHATWTWQRRGVVHAEIRLADLTP